MKNISRTLPTLLIFGLLLPATESSRAQEAARTVEVHAKRFAFDPAEVTMKPGETIKLRIVSDDVPHSLVVPGLKINTPMTKSHPAEVLVTSQKQGDFVGQCGRFCGSGHGAMRFTIHVKE